MATGDFLKGYLESAEIEIGSKEAEIATKDCSRFLEMGLGWDEKEHGVRFWQIRTRSQIGGGGHPDFPFTSEDK